MAASRFFDSNSSLAKVHHRLFQVSLAAPLQLLQIKLLCPQSETTQPLYLRTRSDRFVYRSAIVMSLAGLCVTACALFSMALGSRRSRNKHETWRASRAAQIFVISSHKKFVQYITHRKSFMCPQYLLVRNKLSGFIRFPYTHTNLCSGWSPNGSCTTLLRKSCWEKSQCILYTCYTGWPSGKIGLTWNRTKRLSIHNNRNQSWQKHKEKAE